MLASLKLMNEPVVNLLRPVTEDREDEAREERETEMMVGMGVESTELEPKPEVSTVCQAMLLMLDLFLLSFPEAWTDGQCSQ